MSKLRLVKERKENREDEQDLRGFGDLNSVRDAHPLVYLTYLSNNHENIIKKAQQLNLGTLNFHSENEKLYISLTNSGQLSVKEQSVYMFIISLSLSAHSKDLKQCIWVADKFKFHYSNELNGELEQEFSPNKMFSENNFGPQSELKLNGYVQSYLNESGFSLNKNSLSSSDLNKILKEEFSNLQAEALQTLSKIG